MTSFYERVDLGGLVVLDPFMGSGTTVGEAAKLGCAALGRDINPVAFNTVKVALGPIDRIALDRAFRHVERAVGQELRALYRAVDSKGRPCDVLYYFWVKVVNCPACAKPVDLFSSYVFAGHAYASRFPTVHIVCPRCRDVFRGMHGDSETTCSGCQCKFDASAGPARRTTAICNHCTHEFPIARTIKARGIPPNHRLFAKLVLTADGQKEYLRATQADVEAYDNARERLPSANLVVPEGALEDGHNTKQAINYGYRQWRDFFNARQLLALGTLARAIRDLPVSPERDALALVFSGTLEFNNLFASYKGEGTGAVRHMFSHHILKPERVPIEANPWGLPQSSGSFSTLYRSRLLRALDYKDSPFEVAPEMTTVRAKSRKVFGTSKPLGSSPLHDWMPKPVAAGVYLSCGDSANTGLAPKSVDLVITDPPFFDNVHYSELADFFFSWQRHLVPTPVSLATTRHEAEVQDKNADAFASKLTRVLAECCRVLVEDGLLVFSYHHSRDDGWVSLARAIADAGFSVIQAHPVKAEMSVAAPKVQATDPIDIDILLVCQKMHRDRRPKRTSAEAIRVAEAGARLRRDRFLSRGRALSRNDAKVLLFSRLLVELSAGRNAGETVHQFGAVLPTLQASVDALHRDQVKAENSPRTKLPQLSLDLSHRERVS